MNLAARLRSISTPLSLETVNQPSEIRKFHLSFHTAILRRFEQKPTSLENHGSEGGCRLRGEYAVRTVVDLLMNMQHLSGGYQHA